MIFLFGYVKPQKWELLLREYDQYNGVYCSLCRRLGRSYGPAAKLALNYDCTFFSIVLIALSSRAPRFERKRCTVNPLKKCTYCLSEEEIDAAAAVTVILSYFKIRDNIEDSPWYKKAAYYCLLPVAAYARRRAAEKFPEYDSVVSSAMEEQKKAERGAGLGPDGCAEPTANMLAGLLGLSAGARENTAAARVLHEFGYYLGRWVYLMDAADDLEKDLASGSFNPFALKYGIRGGDAEGIRAAKHGANEALNMTLARLSAALHLMNLNSFGSVIQNVVLKGLPEMQKELLFQKEKTNV